MRAWIATSIAIHAIIAAILKWQPAPVAPETPKKIEVTIHEIPQGNPEAKSQVSRRKNSQSQGQSRGKSQKGKGKGFGLAQLRPNWSSITEPGPNEGRLIDPDARGTSEWPPQSWGAHQGGILKETEFFISYDRLFQEIQGLLYYPGVLGQHGISGTFNVKLAFTEDSQCDWKRTTISQANHYLKFYVMALLKKLCGLEFLKHTHFDTTTRADLNFDFKITDGLPREYDNSPDSIVGNTLLFRREWVKPVGVVKVGPIYWSVFMPTAFTMDPMWFMQKWDEVMNKKDPLDDFRE